MLLTSKETRTLHLEFSTRVGHLHCLGHFCMCVPAVSLKKKMKHMAKTQEQEESNTLSQNKESIYALNSNSAFEN